MADLNYFNFFTEIEEYFWKKRGAHLLVSPLDWAIIETWQKAGIPLAAVLKGIDRAFESYRRSRRGAGRPLKSLAYCVDAVLEAAQEARDAAAGKEPSAAGGAAARGEVFTPDDIRAYLARNAQKLAAAAGSARESQSELAARIDDIRAKLEESQPLLDGGVPDLEDLERRFTILEDKLHSLATAYASEDSLLTIRRELDRQLLPYRRKMSADQLAQVERQYLQKRLFELFGFPRLSLFYLN
ncbi:MAG: hypothetical protein ABSF92_02185 [Candidatus Acidiferrales bacterium]|jgi:hypothetical protein